MKQSKVTLHLVAALVLSFYAAFASSNENVNDASSAEAISAKTNAPAAPKKSHVGNLKAFLNFTGKAMVFRGDGTHSKKEGSGSCLVFIGNVKTNYSDSVFHIRENFGSYDSRYTWLSGVSSTETKGNEFRLVMANSNPDSIFPSAVIEKLAITKNSDGGIDSINHNNRFLWHTFSSSCSNLKAITLEEFRSITKDNDLID